MKTFDQIRDFHAHVYYDAESKPQAATLRTALEDAYPQAVYGRWHDRPVGPHPDWSYQIAFSPDLFAEIIGFISLNRGGLVVFVHPNTGEVVEDHRDHAIWMGAVRPLIMAGLG